MAVNPVVSRAEFDALALRVTACEAAMKLTIGIGTGPSPSPAPAPTIALSWKSPVPGPAPQIKQGTMTYKLVGALLVNVEISVGGKMLSRATCAADGTSASGILNLSSVPVGQAILVADAWNTPAGQGTPTTQHTQASLPVIITS